jgi:hypothetical protein
MMGGDVTVTSEPGKGSVFSAPAGGLNAMNLPRRQFLQLTAGAASLLTVSRIGWAQAYPSRPVTIIVRSAIDLPDMMSSEPMIAATSAGSY